MVALAQAVMCADEEDEPEAAGAAAAEQRDEEAAAAQREQQRARCGGCREPIALAEALAHKLRST